MVLDNSDKLKALNEFKKLKLNLKCIEQPVMKKIFKKA